MSTPLEKAEELYDYLVEHYHDGNDSEIRAATKLLLVALDRLKQHGGSGWSSLLDEYVNIAKYDDEKFRRMLEAQRGKDRKDPPEADPGSNRLDS